MSGISGVPHLTSQYFYGIIQIPNFSHNTFEFFFLTKVVFSPMWADLKG